MQRAHFTYKDQFDNLETIVVAQLHVRSLPICSNRTAGLLSCSEHSSPAAAKSTSSRRIRWNALGKAIASFVFQRHLSSVSELQLEYARHKHESAHLRFYWRELPVTGILGGYAQ